MRSSGVAAAVIAAFVAVLSGPVTHKTPGRTAPKPAPANASSRLSTSSRKKRRRRRRRQKSAPKKKAGPRRRRPPRAGCAARSRRSLPPARTRAWCRSRPLAGSEIPIEKIPRGVSTMNSSDIRRDGSVIPQELLNSRIPVGHGRRPAGQPVPDRHPVPRL